MLLVIYQMDRKLCPQKKKKKKCQTDVYSSFVHNCQNLEVTKESFCDEQVNCGTFRHLYIIQQLKEISSQTIKRHRGSLNSY